MAEGAARSGSGALISSPAISSAAFGSLTPGEGPPGGACVGARLTEASGGGIVEGRSRRGEGNGADSSASRNTAPRGRVGSVGRGDSGGTNGSGGAGSPTGPPHRGRTAPGAAGTAAMKGGASSVRDTGASGSSGCAGGVKPTVTGSLRMIPSNAAGREAIPSPGLPRVIASGSRARWMYRDTARGLPEPGRTKGSADAAFRTMGNSVAPAGGETSLCLTSAGRIRGIPRSAGSSNPRTEGGPKAALPAADSGPRGESAPKPSSTGREKATSGGRSNRARACAAKRMTLAGEERRILPAGDGLRRAVALAGDGCSAPLKG